MTQKLASGSVLKNILYGFVSLTIALRIVVFIPVLYKKGQRHCQIQYTHHFIILLTILHENVDHPYLTMAATDKTEVLCLFMVVYYVSPLENLKHVMS